MSVTMSGCIKPYQLRQEIDNQGAQVTLESALAAIQSEIDVKLSFACPECRGNGIVSKDGGATYAECQTCYGWGSTETLQQVATQTFTLNTNPPQPTLTSNQ